MKPQNITSKIYKYLEYTIYFYEKNMKTFRIVPQPNTASKFKSVLRLILFPLK